MERVFLSSFKELMQSYLFNIFPRYVGTPNQFMVNNWDEFRNFVSENNGKFPLYISHNPRNKEIVKYTQMFFDVDTDKEGTTMSDAQQDIIKLYEYFEDYNKNIVMSGSGFHFYLRFQPKVMIISSEFNAKIKKFQDDLIKKLDLRTVNSYKCARSTHIAGIPGTIYMSSHHNVVGTRWRIPLNGTAIYKSVTEIMDLSKERNLTYIEDNTKKLLLPISEIESKNIEIVKINVNTPSTTGVNWLSMLEEEFLAMAKVFFDKDLYKTLMTPKPAHSFRFIACVKLKHYIPVDDAIQFFDRLSEIAGWTNRNLVKQYEQIHEIYEHNYSMEVRKHE